MTPHPTVYTQRRCPDCDYYISRHTLPGWEEIYHCYNCDEDFSLDELDDPPAVFEATISPPDNQSLTAALEEGTINVTTTLAAPLFPYTLDDVLYWIVKRKTGEIVKYHLVETTGIPGHSSVKDNKNKELVVVGGYRSASHSQSSYSDWCNHYPAKEPVWEHIPEEGSPYPYQRLFIADAPGVRRDKEKFDYVIDAGDVMTDFYAVRKSNILLGPAELVDPLLSHVNILAEGPRVLKIAWADRKAPLLHPSFWPKLATLLQGDVVANCIGGHGRSGTILACLMLVLNPEYNASDAIIHLRAVHCPRAIESWEQHDYINQVAKYLNRNPNAKDVHDIKSFKDAFLALKLPSAAPYQARFGIGGSPNDPKVEVSGV